MTSVSGLFANWQALVLPVVVLSINSVAGFSQYVRSTALQALAEDYIRVVRAKGLPERLVQLPCAAQLAAAGDHDPWAGASGHRGWRGDRGVDLQLPRHGPAVLAVRARA